MPEKRTIERARRDKREGKSASTQAGEFVKEEIDHVREGKHGAKSTQQAIAIGLSKARRAGVDIPAKKGGTRPTKSERKRPASRRSLSKHAKTVAAKRSHADRSRAAKKAAQTRKRNASKKK